MDGCGNLFVAHAIRNIDERWELGWRSGTVLAVACAALLLVNVRSGAQSGLSFLQPTCPGRIAGVNVQDAGLRVYARSSPFASAIESRKNDCAPLHLKRRELSFATQFSE